MFRAFTEEGSKNIEQAWANLGFRKWGWREECAIGAPYWVNIL
jgi:hypothetical protein